MATKAELKEILKFLTRAISTDDTRPQIQSVLVHVDDIANWTKLVATDGYRMHVVKIDHVLKGFLVSERTRLDVPKLKYLIDIVPAKESVDLLDLVAGATQEIEGNRFPPYQSVEPVESKYREQEKFSYFQAQQRYLIEACPKSANGARFYPGETPSGPIGVFCEIDNMKLSAVVMPMRFEI